MEKLTRSLIQNSEPEHQEDDPEDPEYLPEENTDEQDSGDDEPDNIVTRDGGYEDRGRSYAQGCPWRGLLRRCYSDRDVCSVCLITGLRAEVSPRYGM
ncbi:hypothetical protein U9M48_037715 [Paspalum notatum var. saurae]|uniref:Uncharacterized protein n=1 Tax=Paspalum notatum var. saurae TaxID=547442 RepID=A0AAQ3UFH0_PASNO